MQSIICTIADFSYLAHNSGHSDPFLPDRRLCLAMLELAVNDFIKARKNSEEWFEHPDSGGISLNTVCAFLNLEPSAIVTVVKRHRESYQSQVSLGLSPRQIKRPFKYRRRSYRLISVKKRATG